MNTLETRLPVLLTTTICAVLAATYWLVMRQSPAEQWQVLRGIVVVGGTGLVLPLGMLTLRRDMRRRWALALDGARQWILAPGGAALPAPGDHDDPGIRPFATQLRERVGALTRQTESLHAQRRTLERQLHLADTQCRRNETLLQGLSDAVIVTDGFDELLLANPAAQSLFKLDPAEWPGRPIAGVLGGGGGDETPRLAADIAKMRQNPPSTNRRTAEYQLEVEGRRRVFSVTLSRVMDDAGRLSGVVTVLHDRTREDEIARLQTEFVSHVSHELRTPLSSIKAYAELLVDGEAADDQARMEFYRIIQSEADRLNRLIDNILNLSRIESGMARVHTRPVALDEILKRVLVVALPQAREKRIALRERIEPGLPPVMADADMLYQAALNLVGNAIKYTHAGGRVDLSLAADAAARELVVRVTDTGVGIPAEARARLFDKYFRVEKNQGMARGSGLGLNLTRQIIEAAHRGRMIVSSQEGRGSTFGFALPMAAERIMA